MNAGSIGGSAAGAASLVACHHCDLIHRVRAFGPRGRARCTRCGAVLSWERPDSVERTLTLALTGLILLVLANAFPLLTFELEGRSQTNSLISGTVEFWKAGYPELAALVFTLSILAPALSLLLLLYVMLPIKIDRRPWRLALAFRMVGVLRPWVMMEVYMLGVLVAIVKLSDWASIEPGLSLYAFAALIIVTAAANAALDPRAVWRRLDVGS